MSVNTLHYQVGVPSIKHVKILPISIRSEPNFGLGFLPRRLASRSI